jgi:ribosomal protein S18 acetylase RimI-like enzyme
VIEIRQAHAGDSDALASVINETWHDNTADPAHIARVIRETGRVTLLAQDSDQVLGFVDGFLTPAPDGTIRWEIDLLGVRPSARGRQIASRLVTAAVEAGRGQGAVTARALIRLDNPASQRVFAACGFSEQPERCVLYTAGSSTGDDFQVGADGYLLPVVTLTYRGVWIEGVSALGNLAAARRLVGRYGWDAAGAVLPAGDAAVLRAAETAGYVKREAYAWWTRLLTADAAPARR